VGGRQPGLSRGRLAAAALELVQADGLDALTMRRLADRTGVRAASLYWHVRDRGELVELLAQALLDDVQASTGDDIQVPPGRDDWRAAALAICAALRHVVTSRRDAGRIVLEAVDVLERSTAHAGLTAILEAAGLSGGQAREAATMMLVHVLTRAAQAVPAPAAPRPALVAIDTGSRGVTLRAGPAMNGLLRVAHDPTAAAPALIRGDTVIVRRRRGGGQGELELNPQYQWHIALDLAGLDVRKVEIDGGATRVDCALPPPRGVVRIMVAGGVMGLRLRRAPGVKVVAEISAGALQVRLDDRTVTAATSDIHWESAGPSTPDHYRLKISGGAMRVSLEEDPAVASSTTDASTTPTPAADDVTALDLVLDGVASRQR
jgi:AcrR family transcriptional regulator